MNSSWDFLSEVLSGTTEQCSELPTSFCLVHFLFSLIINIIILFDFTTILLYNIVENKALTRRCIMKKVVLMSTIEVLFVDVLVLLAFYQPQSSLVLPTVFLLLFHGLVLLHFSNHMLDYFPEQYPLIRTKLRITSLVNMALDLAVLALSLVITHRLIFLGLLVCHGLLFFRLMSRLQKDFPEEWRKHLSYLDVV